MNRRVLAATAAVVLVAACSQRAPVTIASVSPTSGGPGARLTITGTGLAASATATVCGVGLVDLDVEVGQRKVGAPGTVGALPDTATLTGTVPDLGDSAECVVQVSGPGGPVAWSGRFAFQGKDGGRPVNQAPTTTGLPDLLIGGDETSRVIDLSAAFDDADDGVAALAFAATVTAPDGNVTADVSGTELTLGFPSRSSRSAEVLVTATDPDGGSASASFLVEFVSATVGFEALGLSTAQTAEVTVDVTFGGEHVAATTADQVLELRPGDYSFTAEVLENGAYLDRRLRATTDQPVLGSGGNVVRLELRASPPGAGRIWLPVRVLAGDGPLWSIADAELATVVGAPTSTTARLTSPSAVARAPDGAIWVSGDGAVWRVDPRELEEPEPEVTQPITYGDWAWVSNIAFDRHGNLWTAEYFRGKVSMFTAAQVEEGGEQAPALTISFPSESLGALVFDARGNLWVGIVEPSASHKIYRYDADALTWTNPQPSLMIGVSGPSQRGRVFDIAFDASGDLWYSTDTAYVGHVPAELAYGTSSFTSEASEGVRLPTSEVTALRFDASGDLWTLNRGGVLATVSSGDLVDGTAPAATTFKLTGWAPDFGIFEIVE